VLLELGITCVINATLELPTVAYQKQECMQIAVEDNICEFDFVSLQYSFKFNQQHNYIPLVLFNTLLPLRKIHSD